MTCKLKIGIAGFGTVGNASCADTACKEEQSKAKGCTESLYIGTHENQINTGKASTSDVP